MDLDEPGLQNCFSLSGWIKIAESCAVFTCLMLHRIGDHGSQIWFGASDLHLDQNDHIYPAEIDTEIIGGAVTAFTVITPLILLAYAVEGTDTVHRTSLDVLFSITGAFALIACGGMTCFAWRRRRHVNANNAWVDRSDFVGAGSLGVLCALTGILYLVDAGWVLYRKAVIGDEPPREVVV